LDFKGIFLDYAHEKVSEADALRLADEECKADAAAWVLLAKAREQDFLKG
jgi:hypothetical protein